MNSIRQLVGKHSDIFMVLLVLGVLVVLFAPIPSAVLDFLILTNFSFALLILLLTFYMARPVEFSTFPSLLLIATLFRLSLNVAATRLILSDADAGKVIGSIGSYVVGGNYVIGLIVFLILIVVQYVVVTNGAQRVSEVAARFTLDGMPGQQMSIDADLNMGFIDQEEAQRRRKNIEKEATFYGAMDGASKFVKGDAIAGIIILLIDIVGGLVIGIMQHGMPWNQALQTYTLMTVGDGIVTQVPALVIAVGTGIIVTRSASDGNLGQQALRQITSFPKTLLLVGGVLLALLLLPGIPVIPTMTLAVFILSGAFWAYKANQEQTDANGKTSSERAEKSNDKDTKDDPYQLLAVEPIEVHVGENWLQRVINNDSPLMDRIASFRKQHALELGMVIPSVRFREQSKLSPDKYEILIDGVSTAKGEIRLEKTLAIHPTGDTRSLQGEVTKEPTYGLPAIWIDDSQRELAVSSKFTLVDAQTVFITHFTEILRKESSRLLSRAEVEKLLNRVRQEQPGLVEEIVPTVLSVGEIQKVLQSLLKEKVSIRNISAILETLVDNAKLSKDTFYLVEAVRARLGAAICQSLLGDATTLHVLTLDPVLENRFIQSFKQATQDGQMKGYPLDPQLTEQFMSKLVQQAERMMKSNMLPVLLCSPDLRRHIRSVSERVVPHLRVLSMVEIPQSVELKAFGTVSV